MSVNLTGTENSTPPLVSAGCGKLETTNALVERRTTLNQY